MFHIVVRRTPGTWDAILGLVQRHELPLITSENRPDDVAPQDWCKYILARRHATGRDVADDVMGALTGDDRAAMAMIDELAGGRDLVPKIAAAARLLRAERPDLRGLWGAFVSGGPRVAYTSFNRPSAPAIDELLRADATLGLELYPKYSDYCASGNTASQRDQWMADFFQGESGAFPQPRLQWLARRREELRSGSRLTVIFPTTDVRPVDYLGSTEPEVFLDRMFHVWATRTRFRALMLADNGGIGTYKWDEKVSDPIRDTLFVESWDHYCRDEETTTLRGAPGCG
jgi:hypothetical protein